MPVPGPRTQERPRPGYRNPENREPDFFNHWLRPPPVWWAGRSPGTMIVNLRGNVLGHGQIRRLWRQSIDYIPAQLPFSWTANSPTADRPGSPVDGFHITRALRYMTRSLYMGQGSDHTRFDNLHTNVPNFNLGKHPTIGHGQSRGRPTVRNRLTSFGSRVPTVNKQHPASHTATQQRHAARTTR